MNAAVGLMVIIKVTGFSTDNIIAGFSAIGHEYLQLLYSFTKRLFNWLVELFDHKIVPNVPNTPSNPSVPTNWWPTGTNSNHNKNLWVDKYLSDSINKIPKDIFNSPFNININQPTPWYRDWTSILWIVGLVGVAYIGYKFIIDPLFIESLPSNNNTIPNTNPVASGSNTPSPVTPTQANFLSSTKSLISTITFSTINGIKKLNPLYWLPSTSEVNASSETFMTQQFTNRYDNRYYPFTADNPFDPWFKKLRLYWLGETTVESTNRNLIKRDIINSFIPIMPESPNIISTIPSSPSIGNLGLYFSVNSGGAVEATSSYIKILDKFTSLPGTPNMKPTPILPEFEGGLSTWKDHLPAQPGTTELEDGYTYAKAVGKGIKGKGIWIPDNDNQFNDLSEEII